MYHLNLNAISSCQLFGHAFSEVHGTVLASCATEGDLKVVAAVFEIFIDRLADERFRRVEEAIHLFSVTVEEVTDGLVASGVAAQRFVPVRIRHRPTVKHKTTSVAGLVLRQPALERERCDEDFHLFVTFRLLPLDLSSVSIAMASSRRSCSLFGRYS